MPRRPTKREGATGPEGDSPAPSLKARKRNGPARAAVAPRPPIARVLLVDADDASRTTAAKALAPLNIRCDHAATLASARRAMDQQDYDVAIIDLRLPDGAGLGLVRETLMRRRGPKAVVAAADASLDAAVDAMRAGAVDLIAKPYQKNNLATRVLAAIANRQRDLERLRRTARLKRLCRRLRDSRRQVAAQLDSLCNDLADAYQELADQMTQATLATELASQLRQDLDVESLLRTFLEFALNRTGPTNAAVFLPSNHADFSLGAYVNHDCPRDSAEVLLDHLADVFAPRLQDETEIVLMADDDSLASRLGDDAHWLADTTSIAYSCRHDGECLAVLVFFRDRTHHWTPDLAAQTRIMGDVFAQNLARVIRIHHRHKPENDWRWLDDADDQDDAGDLAA